QREIPELIGDVHDPEIPAELETVDEHRLRHEAHVLRPQVAVPFDDTAIGDALIEQRPLTVDEPRQRRPERSQRLPVERELTRLERAVTAVDGLPEQMPERRRRDALRR